MPESQNNCSSRDYTVAACRANKRRRRLAAVLSIVCSVGLCGCSSSASLRSLTSSGTWNDTIETLRNRSFAAKAYFRREHCFGNQSFPKDFKAGFIAGYEAIADGKPGCLPAFPPKEYWSWEFQSAEGQSQMAAWFAGFPQGVQAAREDGMDKYSHLLGGGSNGGSANQCGNGQCGPAYGQFNPGIPAGPTTMNLDNQNLNNGNEVRTNGGAEGYSSNISDQFGTTQSAPPSASVPVFMDVPSPFPVTN